MSETEKDAAAVALGKRRWLGVTKKERQAHGRRAADKRWGKRSKKKLDTQ